MTELDFSEAILSQILNEQAPFFAVEEPNDSNLWTKNPQIHKDDRINEVRWKVLIHTVWIVPALVRQVSPTPHPLWLKLHIDLLIKTVFR
jgi:hypothetical protein